nr:chromate efflux transporter [Sneathiella chinensis]
MFQAFGRIGLLSFGGPAAQIALMHQVLVEERKWLTERQYLAALNFCMLLPGPEAMQLATYSGWRLHGVVGGLLSGLLFVIPGALVILVLAALYAAIGDVPLVQGLFLGVKAAVLVIVVQALIKISKRALHGADHWIIAGLSLAGIFLLGLPFPVLVIIAGVIGFLRPGPDAPVTPTAPLVRPLHTLKTILVWLLIWVGPLALLALLLGPDHILAGLAWFFSKLAVVTFGGAYAVLAYMGQEVVDQHGWLQAAQMVDALGLAETTPGPLILVTEFVGFLSAYQASDGGSWGLAIAGAVVTLWATFAPCFLWIFAGAPYIEWISGQPRLKSALDAITAAVVGVILNLSLWFALHVFFSRVDLIHWGPLQVYQPDMGTANLTAMGLALLSGYLLLIRKLPLLAVLALSAGLALGLEWLV